MNARLLIVDDQSLIRHGIFMTVKSKYPAWEFHEAGNGIDAYNMALKYEPDLVLMDYNMPKLNGLDSILMILRELPETKIIMVYAELTDEVVMKALAAGVKGFIIKNSSAKDFLQAIKLVMAGKHYMTGRILDSARLQSEAKIRKKKGAPGLFSPRETEVLELVMQGLTSRLIAEKLHISKRTVDRHRTSLLFRSGSRTPAELIRFALKAAIVEN